MEHFTSIPLPTSIVVDTDPVDPLKAMVTVSPCYPGYGTTLGNAMRRVLLSSLPGAAVTAFKIKGVDHEFSTIPGVKEDVVEIILNIKMLRFQMTAEEPMEIELHAKGQGPVTASQFKKSTGVEVANPDHIVATLTDASADFHLKVIVGRGRGYVPVEGREKEKMDVGYIAIDAIYTPIRNVNFRTEHVRVGQMTNFDKLVLDIATDGTMEPSEAFQFAARILVEQFGWLAEMKNAAEESAPEEAATTLEENGTEEVAEGPDDQEKVDEKEKGEEE